MKKLQCLAGLIALLSACYANAQTNLTIYGRLDASINSLSYRDTPTKPSSRLTTVSSDTSWFGIRGVEDLGSGMRAYFKLENGFQVDTGSQSNANTFFNREAYVGLGDTGLGNVQLGSQFSPNIAISAKADPFQRSNLGGVFQLFQSWTTGARGFPSIYNNAVQYLSPTVGGFTTRLMYSLGEGAIPAPNYAGSVEYLNGDLYLAGSYNRNAVSSPPPLAAGPLIDSKTISLAGKYTMNFGSVHGWLQKNELPGLPNTHGFMLGLTIPVGQAEIRTSYSRQNLGTGNASLGAVGYFYLLSKRTTLYAVAARLNNEGSATFPMWPANGEATAQKLPGAGQDINGLQLGIRTHF